ncbi:NAD(+) diphosphatase [Paradesulfitobacterium aromaticivorans]
MFFEPGLSCKADGDVTAYWLLFKGNRILLSKKDKVQFTLPEIDLYKLSKKLIRSQYLDRVEGRSCYVAELTPDTVAPEGMSFYDLRRLLGKIPDDLFFLAGKASHILHWDRTHQYCSQCGAQTENKMDERAKLCPSCGFVNYPRISPAIIVAITRGREILLAKGSRFQADFYSVLAGFVEPGETFEECVQREVEEEVGLKVKNIKYFGSQPWPFPDSLMVGFTAEYASGDIIIDKNEIVDAGWFSVEQLPLIPGIGSIARQLIDWFVQIKS